MSYAAALEAARPGTVLGFEPDPVVTLGHRADLKSAFLWPAARFEELGFAILPTDRGGEATIHSPGQLVIFPALDVRPVGVRRFVGLLESATRRWLTRFQVEATWNPCEPGLYTREGKVVSIGLRVQKGIVRHGLAINVRNDLKVFSGIRVCGKASQKMAFVPTEQPLDELFLSWAEDFRRQLTSGAVSGEFEPSSRCAPSSVG